MAKDHDKRNTTAAKKRARPANTKKAEAIVPRTAHFPEGNRISDVEALARLQKMEGSLKFAAYRLHELMRTGLPTAFGCVTRSGRVTFVLLTKSDLNRLIPVESYVTKVTNRHARVHLWSGGLDAPPDDPLNKCWLYHDHQRFNEAFDKIYSTAAAAYADDVLARNKPGPKPKGNWKAWAIYELARVAIAEENKPTNAKLAEFCELRAGYHPDLPEVGDLVRAFRRLI
jgi:hypothetical protein